MEISKQDVAQAWSRLIMEKRAHHPEEGLIGEALVILDGGENTEDEAHEDRHKPGNKVSP